jgi:hypothetical protein
MTNELTVFVFPAGFPSWVHEQLIERPQKN